MPSIHWDIYKGGGRLISLTGEVRTAGGGRSVRRGTEAERFTKAGPAGRTSALNSTSGKAGASTIEEAHTAPCLQGPAVTRAMPGARLLAPAHSPESVCTLHGHSDCSVADQGAVQQQDEAYLRTSIFVRRGVPQQQQRDCGAPGAQHRHSEFMQRRGGLAVWAGVGPADREAWERCVGAAILQGGTVLLPPVCCHGRLLPPPAAKACRPASHLQAEANSLPLTARPMEDASGAEAYMNGAVSAAVEAAAAAEQVAPQALAELQAAVASVAEMHALAAQPLPVVVGAFADAMAVDPSQVCAAVGMDHVGAVPPPLPLVVPLPSLPLLRPLRLAARASSHPTPAVQAGTPMDSGLGGGGGSGRARASSGSFKNRLAGAPPLLPPARFTVCVFLPTCPGGRIGLLLALHAAAGGTASGQPASHPLAR